MSRRGIVEQLQITRAELVEKFRAELALIDGLIAKLLPPEGTGAAAVTKPKGSRKKKPVAGGIVDAL
jgi:hypothetical protein